MHKDACAFDESDQHNIPSAAESDPLRQRVLIGVNRDEQSYFLTVKFSSLLLIMPDAQGNSIYFKGSKSIFKKKSGLRAAINIIRFLLNLPY